MAEDHSKKNGWAFPQKKKKKNPPKIVKKKPNGPLKITLGIKNPKKNVQTSKDPQSLLNLKAHNMIL